jgi:hypothetical protein
MGAVQAGLRWIAREVGFSVTRPAARASYRNPRFFELRETILVFIVLSCRNDRNQPSRQSPICDCSPAIGSSSGIHTRPQAPHQVWIDLSRPAFEYARIRLLHDV